MKKSLVLTAACFMSASLAIAASPLATTFATMQNDIGNRQIPYTLTPPAQDGTINGGEYAWTSGLITNNGLSSGTTVTDGSDGYGDVNINATAVAPDNAADLSFTLFMSHDATNLYIGVQVVDDILLNPVAAPLATAVTYSSSNCDNIEFYFDGDDTRNGRYKISVAQEDRADLAGGRVFFTSNADGDQTAADVNLNVNAANGWGPTFSLVDGTVGHYKGVTMAAKPTTPPHLDSTDLKFYMKRDNPTVNGNRTLEVVVPKAGLTYNRTDKANPDTTGKAGTFTNNIFGFNVAVDDVDTGTTRQHQLIFENAGEHMDGNEILINADGSQMETLAINAPKTGYTWATNGGILEQGSYLYECAVPRFQLLPAASVENWNRQ